MKTLYLIRAGWNSANQSSYGANLNPKNKFESNYYKLVSIIQAESVDEAKSKFGGSVYSNQYLICETNPRFVMGLTQAIRDFRGEESLL